MRAVIRLSSLFSHLFVILFLEHIVGFEDHNLLDHVVIDANGLID
jgi:hypothetical protein